MSNYTITFTFIVLNIFALMAIQAKPVEDGICPVNWVKFDNHCLFRPTINPDDVCHQYEAKSVLNLFCLKDLIKRPIKTKCPTNWLEYHQHCLYVPTTDAVTYCALHKALVVFDSICIKGQTDNDKYEDNKGIGGQLRNENNIHVEENQRACCPNGFGK